MRGSMALMDSSAEGSVGCGISIPRCVTDGGRRAEPAGRAVDSRVAVSWGKGLRGDRHGTPAVASSHGFPAYWARARMLGSPPLVFPSVVRTSRSRSFGVDDGPLVGPVEDGPEPPPQPIGAEPHGRGRLA